MRFYILQDKKIKTSQRDSVLKDFTKLITDNTPITPTFQFKSTDFSTYEKESDSDGDEHLTYRYIHSVVDPVHNELGDSVDHVVIWIHKDNWKLKGIWGTNYSFRFHSYQVHVCRFDHDNLANALGTFYHEFMHSVDAIIKTYTGVNVDDIIGLPWDKFVVHGGRPDKVGTTEWDYIRYNHNTKALKLVGEHLQSAYRKRTVHDNIEAKKLIVLLLQKLVVLYKQLIYQKTNGIK